VSVALGRLATGALLLASSLEKVTGREPMLTLEADGGGPAGRLVATASPAGWVRAMVANPLATTAPVEHGRLDVAAVIGSSGQLVVTRDPGVGEPYRGVVDLISGELAKDIALYLTESEQMPAAVVLGVKTVRQGRVKHAGGLLVQLLPGVSEDEAIELTDRIRELGAVSSRLESGESPRQWLATIFPDGCTVLEEIEVGFRCGCSHDRAEATLKLLGEDEIRAVMAEHDDSEVAVTCGFCRARYLLPRVRLLELIEEIKRDRT
jgi:molecular chaperone Hsp33